ncbi:hypothetical protein VN97_g5517 [Penicillium thymicola]|uniref:Uncharacterized protein n=1 Tax=Penicillium thymicola TaxID=293382 RepID=A0AAI9TJU3_PENTH|nr:hypothetical protein VN97_g5517 [Penicillium thymicola]
MDESWYKVFRPEFNTVAYDPLDPPKRYHTGVFVEAVAGTLEGALFHVTGDIIASSGVPYSQQFPRPYISPISSIPLSPNRICHYLSNRHLS